MLALSGHLGFFVVGAAPRNLLEQLWAAGGSKQQDLRGTLPHTSPEQLVTCATKQLGKGLQGLGNNPECFAWRSGNGGGRNWVIKKD